MRQAGRVGNQPVQAVIRQAQRVAAAEDEFADIGLPAQRLQRLLPVSEDCLLRVGKVAAETIATMHGAGPGGHQERPAVIFLQQSKVARGGQVADRVGDEPRYLQLLVQRGQHLGE